MNKNSYLPCSPTAERERDEDQNEIKRVERQSCGNRKGIGGGGEMEGWKRKNLKWEIEGF